MAYRMRKLLQENEHISTFRIYKNLIVLAVSFFLLFSAFCSVQNLLSSLYPKYGFLSLCIIYVMFMISCLTIPPILINKIGNKYTLLLSMVGYILHTASNLYPTLPVLIFGASLVGTSFCLTNIMRYILWVTLYNDCVQAHSYSREESSLFIH